MKWFKKSTQSNVLEKTGEGICKYCGRQLPVSALKQSEAFSSCIDSDNCLAFQNKIYSAKQDDDLSVSNTCMTEVSTSKAMDNNSETLIDDGEREQQFEGGEVEDDTSNLFEFPDTSNLKKNEMQKDHTEKINDAISNLQSVFEHELLEMEEMLKNSSGNVHQKVSERKRIAHELKLDKKLLEIYEEIQHYPSWSKREDWLTYRDFEIEDPQAIKIAHEKTISFGFKRSQYCFKYFDNGSSTDFEGEYFHHTKLTIQDSTENKLIEINISVEHDYVTELKPFGITAFVPGNWMKDFLEGYEKMKSTKKKKELLRKYDADEVSSLKESFGLE